MSEKDVLHRFIFDKLPVRGEFIQLQESYQAIIKQHNYPEPLRQLLGEALCVAALLSAVIKFDGRLTVQFRGKGALKLLLAQCNNDFHLRALAKWEGDLTYQDLMQSFEEGVLVIMLDSGPQKTRYQGIVAWEGNSLTKSIEGYFRDSEQLATKLWISVTDESAAGLMLQIVPTETKLAGIDEDVIKPHWMHINQLTEKLNTDDLHHTHYETILRNLYPEEDIRVFDPVNVMFNCTCNRKKCQDAILIIGKDEADAELENKQSIVVTCDFCNKEYIFDRVDVAKIFENNHPPKDDLIH